MEDVHGQAHPAVSIAQKREGKEFIFDLEIKSARLRANNVISQNSERQERVSRGLPPAQKKNLRLLPKIVAPI
jgi:hypothetical protein